MMAYAELLLAGVLGGYLAGLLGIGGGFVVVPALMLLLPVLGIEPGLVPKVAVATSLAAMVPTACSATLAQYRRGALDFGWLGRLAPGAAAGAAIGSQIAASVTGMWVAVVFVTYTGYFALKMLRGRPLQTEFPGRMTRAASALPAPLVGLLIGAFSAIAGVGGASLTVPFLLCSGVEMKRAVALASAIGLAIALAGASGFAGAALTTPAAAPPGLVGLICWPAALVLAASAAVMAPRGVDASHRLPVRHLKRAFAGVLIVACAATLSKTLITSASVAHASAAAAIVRGATCTPQADARCRNIIRVASAHRR